MTRLGGGDRVRTAHRPDLVAAATAIDAAIGRGDLVTVLGSCTVEYEGRASSRLGIGDRLVILKPDGTVLVHTDEGHQPVNWQPPGSDRRVSIEDAGLVVTSERVSPAERLVIRFEAVLHISAFDVRDPSDLALSGTHEDLRRRVLEDPDLLEPGFQPLETEFGTPAGAVDIYGEDATGTPVVVELKRSRVGPDAVGQLTRYVRALAGDGPGGGTVRGILVAPSATERARHLLAENGLEFVSLAPDPDGA